MDNKTNPLFQDADFEYDLPTNNMVKNSWGLSLALHEKHIIPANIVKLTTLYKDAALPPHHITMLTDFNLDHIKDGLENIIKTGKTELIEKGFIPENYTELYVVADQIVKVLYHYIPDVMTNQMADVRRNKDKLTNAFEDLDG